MSNYFGNILPTNLNTNDLFGSAATVAATAAVVVNNAVASSAVVSNSPHQQHQQTPTQNQTQSNTDLLVNFDDSIYSNRFASYAKNYSSTPNNYSSASFMYHQNGNVQFGVSGSPPDYQLSSAYKQVEAAAAAVINNPNLQHHQQQQHNQQLNQHHSLNSNSNGNYNQGMQNFIYPWMRASAGSFFHYPYYT